MQGDIKPRICIDSVHKLFLASSFCIITWESSHIAWVHLEIFKKIILFEKWNKVENAKIAKFDAFFSYLPIEISKIKLREILSGKLITSKANEKNVGTRAAGEYVTDVLITFRRLLWSIGMTTPSQVNFESRKDSLKNSLKKKRF